MSRLQTIDTYTADIGALWTEAMFRYETRTGVCLDSVGDARSLDEVLSHIQKSQARFEKRRHSGSRFDKFRTLVKRSLEPVEPLGRIVSQATKDVRPDNL